MSKPIFVFICDGTAKYFDMTVTAIKTLKQKSPAAVIGVIVPPNKQLPSIIDQVKHALDNNTKNIIFRSGKTHFDNWNPTQHKLDILLFAQEFDPLIWIDSDTIILKDLLPYASQFTQSGKRYAFLKDHVNNDPNFLANWEDGPEGVFIPQACYMMFRSAVIKSFFDTWETIWADWITPAPFAKHKDPLPNFVNSFFCIEQYALGQALRKVSPTLSNDVFFLDRLEVYIGHNVVFDSHILSSPETKIPVTTEVGTGAGASTAVDGSSKGGESVVPGQVGGVTGGETSETGLESAVGAVSIASSYSPTSYVSSYVSSYPSSVGAVSSYVSSYQGAAVSSYQTSGVSSYQASTVTSYQAAASAVTSYQAAASAVTSYQAAASAVTSYQAAASAVTSYQAAASAVTSYQSAVSGVTSYGAVTSYGVVSSAQSVTSSYGVTSSYNETSSSGSILVPYDVPLLSVGAFQLGAPVAPEISDAPTPDSKSSSLYIYTTPNEDVYFLSTNPSLAQPGTSSTAPVSGGGGSGGQKKEDFYMVDLVQDNSIAHYYNANYGPPSDFLQKNSEPVVEVISENEKKKKTKKKK